MISAFFLLFRSKVFFLTLRSFSLDLELGLKISEGLDLSSAVFHIPFYLDTDLSGRYCLIGWLKLWEEFMFMRLL